MKRAMRHISPLMTLIIVFVMISSGMAMGVGQSSTTETEQGPPSLEAHLRALGQKHGIEIAPIFDLGTRPSSRQDHENEFEVLSPYPTAETVYGVEWKPSNDRALLVGSNGLILEYDGVYFDVIDTGVEYLFRAVTWHPSGSHALICSQEGKLYRYQNGIMEEIRTGTSSSLVSLDYSPDGEDVILVGGDGTVYLYDGEVVAMIGDFGPIGWLDVSWHPSDGTALLAGYEWVNNEYGWYLQGRVFQYDMGTGLFTNLRPDLPEDLDTALFTVDWNNAGSMALFGGYNALLLSYDGDVFGTVTIGQSWLPFLALDFSSRNEALAVGYYGLVARYRSGSVYWLDTGGIDTLTCVAYSSPGDIAIVGGEYGTIFLYDADESTFEKITAGASVTFYDVAWRPDWSYALLVGSGGAIYRYDGEELTSLMSPTTETLLGVAFNPEGSRALIVGTSGTLLEFQDGGYGDSTIIQRLSGTIVDIWDVDYNALGNALFVGDGGEVREWSGNFATKVVSRTNRDLRSVDWKNSDTAYIAGTNGEVLRYSRTPVSRIDIASPSNIFVGATLYSVLWEDDKERGLMVGTSGTLLEHYENMEATTIDDSYGTIATNAIYDLFDIDWMYNKRDALIVGDFGTVLNFRDATDGIETLKPNTIQRLNGVAWKGNQYALIVGGSGTILRYWPNEEPPAVTLNKPTDITDNSMKLTWSESTIHDFSHYEIHMSETEGFTPSTFTKVATQKDSKKTTFSLTDLRRDTTYYFKVRVVDTGKLYADSNEVYGHTLVGQLAPVAVTLYEPTDITSTAMILSWSRNRDTDFDHYEVHMSTTEGFQITGNTVEASIGDQYETEYSVTGLASNTTFYFRVRVVDEDGLFNDSNEVNGTTESENFPPLPVTLNDPFNITDDTLELNWTRNEEADFQKYELHYSTVDEFNISASTLEATFIIRNETAYRFEGLTPLTEYFFKVRVFDTEGLKADSNQVSATTLEYNAPPEPVELYEPVNITENTIKLNWSRNNDTDFDRYAVHYGTEANFDPNASNLANVIGSQNQTTYTVDDLIPGITYVFKVRVYDEIGQFADSNEVMGTTISNEPPDPVELEVTSTDVTSVTLRWTTNEDSDFARYEVHYSMNANFTVNPANLYEDVTNQHTRNSQVTGLLPNTTYYFVVRVVDEFNLYSDSNRVNSTTFGQNIPPRAVVLGEPHNITRSSMELYWGQSLDQDFSYYELHRSTTEEFEPTTKTVLLKFTGRNQTGYNVTGLKMDTEYYYKVMVYDTGGLSNTSNEVMGKTLPPNVKPIADAGNDVVTYTTDKVKFVGLGTDPDGKIVKFEWDFETDGTYDFENGVSGVTEHLYTAKGQYVATLRVTDNSGDYGTDIVNITVEEPPLPNQPPRANAGPDQTVVKGDVVTFEGTGEDDDGAVILYEWDYDGDGNYDDYSYSEGSGEYKFDEEGIFKSRLRVTDNENATHSDVAVIRVEPKNTPPVADIDRPYDGRKYYTDEFIQFDGSTSKDEDEDSLTYEWTDSMSSGIMSTKKKFSKQLKEGRHTITLKVSDGTDEDVDEVSITIEEPENDPPRITISEPKKNTKVKGIISISGSASDEDGIIESVCVKIDSGSCKKADGKSNWFLEWDTSTASKGSHTIKAIATDDRGDEDEASVIVTVQKDEKQDEGFFEAIPGFEAPFLLIAAAVVAIGLARRRYRR